MKLLIVGGTGVLSTAITQEALNRGIDVSMINRGNRSRLIPSGVKLFKVDVNNKAEVLQLLSGHHFNAIIDFICYTESQLSYSFELFKNFADQYIFISSCAVYNTLKCNFCTEESPKELPIWKYSVDKVKCENLLVKLATENNKKYTIIRPCVTYGNTRIPYGVTPPYGYHWTLVERILNNKPIIIWNGGKNRSNIMRVEDFAVGAVGLVGNENAYNEAFNICGDETPTWLEVLDTLAELIGKEIKTINIPSEYYAKEVPYKKGEILGGRSIDSINSNIKIKTLVPEFKQTISLNEGIKMTLDYYKSNNYIQGIDYSFDAETDRIILKYAKKTGIAVDKSSLMYIDYLNENKFANRYKYFIGINKNNILIKFIFLAQKYFNYLFKK